MKVSRLFYLGVVAVLVCSVSVGVFAQQVSMNVYDDPKQEVQFPDIMGYETLVCDLHMHTVFSDGLVWPTVRVEEAWREGLDVIAISDHIEYQPHKDDIPTNFNRPFEIANPYAKVRNLLMPRAAEITKDTPPGHFNAIFLKDIDPVENEDVILSLEEANKQGGFVFWNHQGWKGAERGKWGDVQEELYVNRWLHGIEVCNGGTYYPDGHRYGVEKGLTLMGTSDVHAPMLDHPRTPENHRTVTLVFADDKTMPALKEALFAGRSVVWYKNQLIGQEKFLDALFHSSVDIRETHLTTDNSCYVEINNCSEISYELQRNGSVGPQTFTIPAKSTIMIRVSVKGDMPEEMSFPYIVKNLLIAPERGLPVTLDVSLQ